MSLGVRDLAATIRATKQRLKAQIADRRKVFAEVEEDMRREVEGIRDARAQGRPVIPSVDYAKLRSGGVPEEVRQEIRRRGAVVVRGVFS
ncbi:MAG: YbiU family protein, partial [Solirubrobacterales bacterium]